VPNTRSFQPPDPDPRRHRSSHGGAGDPGRPQPRHGSPGRRLDRSLV